YGSSAVDGVARRRGERDQGWHGRGISVARPRDRLRDATMCGTNPIVGEPCAHLRGCPRGVLIGMAAVTSVRRARGDRRLRIGSQEGVIVARIPLHVDRGGHVTAPALGPRAPVRVMRV